MTQEEKARAYDKAIEKIKYVMEHGVSPTLNKEDLQDIFPELKESEDERISREITEFILTHRIDEPNNIEDTNSWLAWLEKQSEQKSTQGIEPFEAEHGKYYYCIKDYFCGGKKQASKGDVVQALRGLPIMGLNDASEYFLPINFIKCNSVCGEEDERIRKAQLDYWCSVGGKEWHGVPVQEAIAWLEKQAEQKTIKWTEKDESKVEDIVYFLDTAKAHYASTEAIDDCVAWLESLRLRKQWSEEDKEMFDCALDMIEWYSGKNENRVRLVSNWLKSIKQKIEWKPTKEQMKALHDLNLAGNISYIGQGQLLIDLYNDLKKLIE